MIELELDGKLGLKMGNGTAVSSHRFDMKKREEQSLNCAKNVPLSPTGVPVHTA